mmetsp:Transcript_19531/g.45425  ORF Transcript_19531/g.45425 Transcript_19531/m.45425 type:complete len:446 (-) Transcript_19531:333-1670(-)
MGTGASAGISAAAQAASEEELKAALAGLPEEQKKKLAAALGSNGAVKSKGTICICGGGNAAHVFIPYFSKNGYEVSVFADFQDEAERLKKAMSEHGGITVRDRRDPNNIVEFKAAPVKISKDPAEVIPSADVIVAALPAFAIKNVLTGIKPHLKKGATIFIMPGQGAADLVAKQIIGDELKEEKVTMAGCIPMPLNCRITEWGKSVDLAALKSYYDLAAVPSKNGGAAAALLSDMLGKKVNPLGNYCGIHLHASNPNIHPGRTYALWKDFTEGKVYPENPLFYETWDDLSDDYVQKISDERIKVWKEICAKLPGSGDPEAVPQIKPYIEAIYAGQIADTSKLKFCFSTNDGFKGFRCPMKQVEGGFAPDFQNRYFTEDIPEGLCVYKGIADLAGVAVPTIDEILGFFQGFMNKEYLKDGKLAGKDVGETKAPQAFGITDLKDLVA